MAPTTEASTAAEAASSRPGDIRARVIAAVTNRSLAGAALAPLIGAAVTLWLVIPTLAPGLISMAAGDSAEFQTVSWVLGTAHPTGYPSYVILGFIATHLLQFGDPAFRMNLLQAFLSAGAVAGAIAVVQLLTGMRWIALATGLLMLTMPAFTTTTVNFPPFTTIQTSPVFWRLSTYADPHMFHVALVALLFLLLLVWERRRTSHDPDVAPHADRWLLAAACVYGVALANHSLTMMLAPGIALFVIAVAPKIVFQWRLILTSAAVLAGTAVLFWLELPIRAAMHAPLVYAHPDTWNGFMYVVTGQQFGGIPPTIGADLSLKYAQVLNMLASWLGPLGFIAVIGLGSSVVRRPRFVLLSLLAGGLTAGFAAAYVNSDLERYFLVPVFVAFTYIGLGLADMLSIGASLLADARDSLATRPSPGRDIAADADRSGATAPDDGVAETPATARLRPAPALMALEIAVAIVMIVTGSTVVAARQGVPDSTRPGAVSQATQTGREAWMNAVLAPADQGGLPTGSVIVSNWYDSTTLWYGQKVEGRRPDIYVVDDTMRVPAGENLGQVWDVIDTYLGRRPVFLLRFSWNCDGFVNLAKYYDIQEFPLPNNYTIKQVTAKVGPVSCS
jgi:Protein of unknown function (DUF2723)